MKTVNQLLMSNHQKLHHGLQVYVIGKGSNTRNDRLEAGQVSPKENALQRDC